MKPETFTAPRHVARVGNPDVPQASRALPAPLRSTASATSPVGPRKRVCFLYIAQAHQVPHSISAAVELARTHPEIEVHVAATTRASLDFAREIVATLGGAPVCWRLLAHPWLAALTPNRQAPPKLPMLLASLRTLGAYDVIVAPERTTAALRLFGLRRQKLVYTQHGAGDRAGPFEPRLKRFDLVFAAGAKQRDRMLAEGLVSPASCAVVGYPKFDVVDATPKVDLRLFADRKPVVLYNPHFDRRLSSWPRWGARVLETFARQTDYNLVFAPHVRLFRGAAASELRALDRFREHPAIHIDLGTRASLDMTYTGMADLYLGDVSSQVYEFLRRPRPCLFLNAHDSPWREDESYRHWRFGPVIDEVDALPQGLRHAWASHADFVEEQVASFNYTFARTPRGASATAAEAIARLVSEDEREVATAPADLQAIGGVAA